MVGFVGFMIDPGYFRALSPLNLLLSTGLILIMANQTKWQFYLAFLAAALAGFFVEVLGVKTEMIFGSYFYGKALGYKLFAVPLLIGLNWAVLLYSTAQLSKFKNVFINAFFGALLMTILDFFIEQSASRFDFWYWKGAHIPIQNYIAWFLISFGLNLWVQKHFSQKDNFTAKAFYFVQLVFFASLYFFV